MVSLYEASHGHAAKTTASRDAAGKIVGDSTGSRYARQQEAEKEQIQQQAVQQQTTQQMQPIQQPQQQAGFLYPSLNDQFKQEKAAIAAEQIQRQQQTQQQNPGLWERTVSTFKTGYDAGRSGNLSLSDLKDLSRPGWGVEGAIAGKIVSAGVGIIGEDRLKAYTAGYEMGRGRSADISSLQAPNQGKDKMISAPLYEGTDNFTKGLSAYRDSMVKPLPGGLRQVVTGVSDFPIAVIDTFGKAPMGVETIVRNPTSSIDSIGLGLGVLAGGIVTTGEKEPGRLVGQLAGGYVLGKGAGAAWSKVKPAKVEKVSVTETERQFSVLEGVEKTKIDTLGTPREYTKLKTRVAGENELNPLDVKNANNMLSQDSRTFNVKYTKTRSATDYNLNTDIKAMEGTGQIKLSRPNIIQAEQKTLTGESIVKVDKGKWNVDLSGIPDNKFSYQKRYGVENYLGKETFDYDFATTVENTRIRTINEVIPEKGPIKNSLPEGAEKYFDVPKTPKQASLFDTFGESPDIPTIEYRGLNLLPGEKPGYYARFKTGLERLTTDETGTLFSKNEPLPELVQEPKVIPGRPKTELDFWKRDIILEELQPKITTSVKSFEIPNTYSSLWGWSGAGLSVISQPFITQLGEQTFNPVKEGIWELNIPKIDISSDISEKSGIGLKTQTFSGTKNDIIFDTRIKEISDIEPDTKTNIDPVIIPDIIPDISTPDPWHGTPTPDPWTDTPDPWHGTPTPDPWTFNPFPEKKNPDFFFGGGGWDFYRGLNDNPRKRRKTKDKTLKNEYGDPFKLKIKLNL